MPIDEPVSDSNATDNWQRGTEARSLRVYRGVRWRVVGQTRKVMWLYRGVRWRVVGQTRKVTWLYRGVRWRVVGQTRKVTWLYRGVRWRVVGQTRKVMWFGRRRWRKIPWLVQRGGSMVRGYLDSIKRFRALAPAVGGGRTEWTRALTADFVDLTQRLELQPPSWRLGSVGSQMRLRLMLFYRLAASNSVTTQRVDIEVPAPWGRAMVKAVGDARFVVVNGAGQHRSQLLSDVLPILISGRPVVVSGELVGSNCELPAELSVDPGQFLTMSESELHQNALAQLRSIVRVCGGVEGARRPAVSVVMSTNRPDFVLAAVDRIQRQENVDIELIIACHGFSASDIDESPLVAGAVRSVEITEHSPEAVFGDVLADLSDRATCERLTKWDDDDLYGPNHVFDLWLFSVLSRSALVGKAAEFVLLEDRELLVRRRGGPPYRVTRFLAGGALMMSVDVLRGIGNWASIPRSVDQDIIGRFESAGFPPMRIHGYEFVLVRHDRGHTWSADPSYFERGADEIQDATAIAATGLQRPMVSVSVSPEVDQRTGSLEYVPSIDVCVPNKGNQDSVRLFEQQRANDAVASGLVIADDRSDPPLELADAAGGVRIVRVPPLDGFGAGRSRHVASAASTADVIVFTDADMYLEPDVVARIQQQFADGFRGVIHARISFTKVEHSAMLAIIQASGTRCAHEALRNEEMPGQTWREVYWATSADYAHPRTSTYRASVGAFVALDRASYETTGGFRDVSMRGVEDIEFGYRLLAAGCEQRLDRCGGIWHLGERAFATSLGESEQQARETALSAYVPVWSQTLAERRAEVTDWDCDVVPFIEVADEALRVVLEDEYGRGSVCFAGEATSLLNAPFAVTEGLDAVFAVGAVHQAFLEFRNSHCGEVIVVDDGREVARLYALWAINLAAHRDGLLKTFVGNPGEYVMNSLRTRIRTEFGLSIVSLKH